jgi:hypothetical protein
VCKSSDVKIVQDACIVFNTGGKGNGGVGMKMGYMYSSSCDCLIQFVLLVNEHKTAQPLSSATTGHFIHEKPHDEA